MLNTGELLWTGDIFTIISRLVDAHDIMSALST